MNPFIAADCQICGLPFARIALPRRHDCPFCGRAFRRVDGAKRHTKTCASRGDRLLPPDAKRGRKSRACDVCCRLKVSCDSKSPCTRCASRGSFCTYDRLCTNPLHRGAVSVSQHVSASTRNQKSLQFLHDCVDPFLGPVDEIIFNGQPAADSEQPSRCEMRESTHIIAGTIDPRLLLLASFDPQASSRYGNDATRHELNSGSERLVGTDDSDEQLDARIILLENEIQKAILTSPDDHICSFLDFSTSFFSCTNFRTCINVFFQHKNLLATIIHKPTFNPVHVDAALLLAVAVCGFAYLQYGQHDTRSRLFSLALRGVAERYVFDRLDGCQNGTAQCGLEVCQAAYMMETLLSCVKEPEIRRHVVTKCHPILVNMLRRLGMIGVQRELAHMDNTGHEFVYRESCARLVHWVFINDAWLSLLTNHPPAMTFLDMDGALPCGDELWDLDYPRCREDFARKVERSLSQPCLKSLISGLLGDTWNDSTVALYRGLEIDHFLVIVLGKSCILCWTLEYSICAENEDAAFQHIIFHNHTLTLVDDASTTLVRGLDRWDCLWKEARTDLGPTREQSLGLVKYSTELAMLFRRIVEANNISSSTQPKYLQRNVTYDTSAFYQFIQQCNGQK